MDLDKLLKEYREISLSMIEKIKNEEEISSSLQKRQSIINEINNLNIDKQIISKKIDELGIINIDKEVEELIKNSMLNVKKQIKKIKQSQEAHKKYVNFNGNPVIFSTKI